MQNWKGTNEYLPSCPQANAFPGREELPVSQEDLTGYSTHLQTGMRVFLLLSTHPLFPFPLSTYPHTLGFYHYKWICLFF